MGLKAELGIVMSELSAAVERDRVNGITAKNHDESHLNSWKTRNSHTLLTPEWAYADGYRNLKGLIPLIKVIHKPSTFIREN